MNKQEFIKEFGRLLSVYGRINPNDDQVREWFDSLGRISKDDLHWAISACRDEETEFPASPAVLWSKFLNRKIAPKRFTSCVHCAAGVIWFDVPDKEGKIQERISACDCEAGDRRVGVNYQKGRMVRYSSMFPISSANAGMGYREAGSVVYQGGRGVELSEGAIPHTDSITARS